MTDLEQRLERHLRSVADLAVPRPDASRVTGTLSTPTGKRGSLSRRRWLVAAAAIVVVTGVVGLIAVERGRSTSNHDRSTVPTVPTSVAPPTSARENERTLGVHDLDACGGGAETDAGSDEPVLLGERLQFGEYWLEITTSPEYVSPPVAGEARLGQLRFSAEPGLSRVRVTEADSARADLSWEEFIGRGPVLTNALASTRLASLALEKGESVLLPVYWAEEIESWVAGLTFAVDRSGAVTAVGNCLNPMTAQIERLRRKAAYGGADMTAREFLLTTPRETIATLEFG